MQKKTPHIAFINRKRSEQLALQLENSDWTGRTSNCFGTIIRRENYLAVFTAEKKLNLDDHGRIQKCLYDLQRIRKYTLSELKVVTL